MSKKEELSEDKKEIDRQFNLNVYEEKLVKDERDMTELEQLSKHLSDLETKVKTLEIEVKRILEHLGMKAYKEELQGI